MLLISFTLYVDKISLFVLLPLFAVVLPATALVLYIKTSRLKKDITGLIKETDALSGRVFV